MSRTPEPAAAPLPIPPLPRWLRQAAGRYNPETALFSAGAAMAVLDPLARSDDPVTTLWRKRLALTAVAAVADVKGRRKGEAQLRDAIGLRPPGDDPGPAGRMLLAARRLSAGGCGMVRDLCGRLGQGGGCPRRDLAPDRTRDQPGLDRPPAPPVPDARGPRSP